MIKLDRYFTPIYLTPQKVRELTDEFKQNGTNVWNNDEIKKPLLMLSHNKCAYCECDLSKESKYMEVEHFEDKNSNPDKVVKWDNLLPSCKRCNGSKSTHDVLSEPIINPFQSDPRQHLAMKLYRFVGIDNIGISTIEVIDLNNTTRATIKRFEIGNAILDNLDVIKDSLNNYRGNPITKRKNKVIRQIEKLLLEAQPQSEYAATAATVLQKESSYPAVKLELQTLGLWNNDLEALDNISKDLAFN